MKLLTAVATIFVSIFISSCTTTYGENSEGDTRYFAALAGVISPFLEYNPRGEISASEAENINHYQVHYDAMGRMAQIAYFQTRWPSNGSYFRTHMVRYTYANGGKVRAYFDVNGEPSSKWRHYYQSQNVHREVFKSHNGSTLLQLFGVDGERVEVGTTAYRFESMKNDNTSFTQTHFKMDGSHAPLMTNLPFETVLITIDENGYLERVINWDSNAVRAVDNDELGYAEMRLNFDEYGNEMGWEYRTAAGDLVNDPDDGYAKIFYDQTWIDRKLGLYSQYQQKSYDQTGALFCTAAGICSTVVKRDRRGNIISRAYYDFNDELINNPATGEAFVQMTINERGQRIEVRYYDKSGDLKKDGIAVRRYAYGDSGEKESEMLLDSNLNECCSE